jgi:hypothetical protein
MKSKSEVKKEYWASRSQEERTSHAKMMATVRHDTMSGVEKAKLILQLQHGKRRKVSQEGD